MATISSTFKLYDNMTKPMKSITNALSQTISSFERMQKAAGQKVDLKGLQAAKKEIAMASKALDELGTKKDPLDGVGGSVDNLTSKFKNLAIAAAGAFGASKLIDLSDTLANTQARLSRIVREGETLEGLQERIFASASRSRGDYIAAMDAVAALGQKAGEAFNNNNDTIIQFVENLNKEFMLTGTSQQEAAAATLQMTQALGSGVLRGDELNSIFEAAPTVIKRIADHMKVPIGSIRELASQGKLTSDVIVDAMLGATDVIEADFQKMPKTFDQIMQDIQNNAVRAFQPLANEISRVINSERFQEVVQSIIQGLSIVGNIGAKVFSFLADVIGQVYDIFEKIAPIVFYLAGAFIVYKTAVAIITGVQTAWNAVVIIGNTLLGIQLGLVAKIALGLFAVVSAVLLAVQIWNMMTGSAVSGIGVIIGAIYALKAIVINVFIFIANLGIAVAEWIVNGWELMSYLLQLAWYYIQLFVLNVLLAIANGASAMINAVGPLFVEMANALGETFYNIGQDVLAVAESIAGAVDGLINGVISGLESLINSAIGGVNKLIGLVNKIPGISPIDPLSEVSLDRSNMGGAVSSFRNSLEKPEKMTWKDVDLGAGLRTAIDNLEKPELQQTKIPRFAYNDIGDAYDEGYKKGKEFEDKIKDLFKGNEDKGKEGGDEDELTKGLPQEAMPEGAGGGGGGGGGRGGGGRGGKGIKGIKDDTGAIRDELDLTNDQLAYLRDIAEQEAINRFTTAEIKVDLSGMSNNINNEMDLDGVVDYLVKGIEEGVEMVTEGV